MYLESFTLPISQEDKMIGKRMRENGGDYGYIVLTTFTPANSSAQKSCTRSISGTSPSFTVATALGKARS